MTLLELVKLRLKSSITTIPDSSDCTLAIILMLLFAIIIAPLGFYFNFLKLESTNLSLKKLIHLGLVTFFFPAFAEELFFRVLLLPHSNENMTTINQYLCLAISISIFVIYHPLNSFFFMQSARKIFTSLIFLLSTTLLGFICSIIYLSSSSIYPSIIIHWIVVFIWLAVLGGYKKLNADKL